MVSEIDLQWVILMIYFIVKCVNLNVLINEHLIIKASDDDQPSKVNTSLSFSCKSPERVLTGPNSTTCMDDGNWEPDPKDVECKGIHSWLRH